MKRHIINCDCGSAFDIAALTYDEEDKCFYIEWKPYQYSGDVTYYRRFNHDIANDISITASKLIRRVRSAWRALIGLPLCFTSEIMINHNEAKRMCDWITNEIK